MPPQIGIPMPQCTKATSVACNPCDHLQCLHIDVRADGWCSDLWKAELAPLRAQGVLALSPREMQQRCRALQAEVDLISAELKQCVAAEGDRFEASIQCRGAGSIVLSAQCRLGLRACIVPLDRW